MESEDKNRILQKECDEAYQRGKIVHAIIVDDMDDDYVSYNPKLLAERLKWINKAAIYPQCKQHLNRK